MGSFMNTSSTGDPWRTRDLTEMLDLILSQTGRASEDVLACAAAVEAEWESWEGKDE